MAEKIREAWYRWIPSWLPMLLALFWIGMQYQRNNDRLERLEKGYETIELQIIAIQDYMRNDHDHQKGAANLPDVGAASAQKPAQTAFW